MPTKSNSADSEHLSEQRIRERAYLLWEADGRPEGRGDHYWYLAHQEARKFVVERTADAVARITKGRHPNGAVKPESIVVAKAKPAEPKANGKAKPAAVKPAAPKARAKPAAIKPAEIKPARRSAPRTRGAAQKAV